MWTNPTSLSQWGETNAPGIQSSCLVLFSDLCADIVFLLIRGLLFLFCYVAAILGRHFTFFLSNLAIVFLQPGCFSLAISPSLTSSLMDCFDLPGAH